MKIRLYYHQLGISSILHAFQDAEFFKCPDSGCRQGVSFVGGLVRDDATDVLQTRRF